MRLSSSSGTLKKIKLPENLPAELYTFPLLSGYQTYDSFRKTPDKNKANNLKLNLSVLAGTTLGILGGYKALGGMLKNTNKMSKIKKDLLQTTGAPVGGVIGGFISGVIANKAFPIKPLTEEEKKLQTKSLVETAVQKKKDKKTTKKLKQAGIFLLTLGGAIAGNRFSRAALKSTNVQSANLTKAGQKTLNSAGVILGAAIGLFVGDRTLADKKIVNLDKQQAEYSMGFILQEASPSLGSFEAGTETSLKNRVKKTFYQTVANVIVPSAFMLPIMLAVRNNLEEGKVFNRALKKLEKISPNKSTKKFICEKTITVPVAIASYALGRALGDLFDKKVTKKILEQSFWNDLDKLKKDAIKSSMEGIASNDKEKTQKALAQLSKVREMEENAKNAKESFSSSKRKSLDTQNQNKNNLSVIPV